MHRFELGACDRQAERQADEQIAACAEHKNYSLKDFFQTKNQEIFTAIFGVNVK